MMVVRLDTPSRPRGNHMQRDLLLLRRIVLCAMHAFTLIARFYPCSTALLTFISQSNINNNVPPPPSDYKRHC